MAIEWARTSICRHSIYQNSDVRDIMPTEDVLTEQVGQGGLFMDEQKILLKLADVLLEENLINANERVELMKLICNGR